MSEIPLSWANADIGDLIALNPKNDCTDDMVAGFVPMHLLGKDYRSSVAYERRSWGEIKKGYTHFADGDVLLAKITPCFENGKAGLVRGMPNGVGAGSTEYFVSRPKPDALDARYLLAFFKTQQFLTAGALQMTGSVGHKRVPKEYLIETEIALAPRNEQTRVADELDAVLARVDACRDRLDRIPTILKRFRQSVLAAATSGKLEDESGEGNCDKGSWRMVNVGALLADIRYGTAKKCYYEPQETPVIRIPNVSDGRVSHTDLKYADFDDVERRKLSLVAGDILMIRSNGSVDLVGRTALATKADAGFLYAGYLIRLRVNHGMVNPAYLSLALSAPDARNAIELTARSTSGVNNINAEEIKALNIELPDLAEQTEIVHRVESLFAFADRLEARYTIARTQVEKLTPSLLAKAFRGELVPQDPNDEPASVLLERIRKQRGEQTFTKSKRGRKMAATSEP